MPPRCLIPLLVLLALPAQADDHFIGTQTLPDGRTLLVAEGEREARSLGSFSVRLYERAAPEDATTFFLGGVIRPRDGTVESLQVQDLDGDGQPELIVALRSAGSGGYRSAQAFALTDNAPRPLTQVEGLPADADLLSALRASLGQQP